MGDWYVYDPLEGASPPRSGRFCPLRFRGGRNRRRARAQAMANAQRAAEEAARRRGATAAAAAAAGRAAATAIYQRSHSHRLATNNPGVDKLRVNLGRNAGAIVKGGGAVATAVGAIYPPAGIIIGAAVAGVGAVAKREQAIEAARRRHADANKLVLHAALRGGALTRGQADEILTGQGWKPEEKKEQLPPVEDKSKDSKPDPPPSEKGSSATVGLAGLALALL